MWQHPKYIPRISEQPSRSLCHCIFIATQSSPNQLDVIASLEKAAFKLHSAWQGLYHIFSGLFLQLLADSFHLLSLLCSILCFSTFSLSFLFPSSDPPLSSSPATPHSQHNSDEDKTAAASEHHLQTHSLLHPIDKTKAQSHPLPTTPNACSSSLR